MNNGEKRGPFYCYNIALAQHLLECGCVPDAIGRGKFGDVYVRFPQSEALGEGLRRWSELMRKVRGKQTQ